MTRRLAQALRRQRSCLLALGLLALLVHAPASLAHDGPGAGFQETVALSGLFDPTSVAFAPDGRILVAEKSGQVLLYDGFDDPTPTLWADLSDEVYSFWDRGLLGLALDPDWPADPAASGPRWVYLLYSWDYDSAKPWKVPRWGTSGILDDPCPTPPGPTQYGCVVSNRLVRIELRPRTLPVTAPDTVLLDGADGQWCHQYPSHSVGDIAFGPDGSLYASSGEGASFTWIDHGQGGSPRNPCGDPVTASQWWADEGGALRSQDVATLADPVGLGGSVIRVNRTTGAGDARNPLATSFDANARRLVAVGLRNPFRLAVRPGTGEVWVGDVGWMNWEEINRIEDAGGTLENFGWPCREGFAGNTGYEVTALCVRVAGSIVPPFAAFSHVGDPQDGPCGRSSAVTGLAFAGPAWPAPYGNALFVADYANRCIWALPPDADGVPDRSRMVTFSDDTSAVALRVGPGGDLFAVDLAGGVVRRFSYSDGNLPPVAAISAERTVDPLTLELRAVAADGEDGALTHAWDLDGDRAYDDGTTAQVTRTYPEAGIYPVGLRVTDANGVSATATALVPVGEDAPVPTIASPRVGATWATGERIFYSATAPGDDERISGLRWGLILHHCEPGDPDRCHAHDVSGLLEPSVGALEGWFTAPDHGYPSYLELRLTAVAASGRRATSSIRLEPRTAALHVRSEPSGVELRVSGSSVAAPGGLQAIVGSTQTLQAPEAVELEGRRWVFASWSNGGARLHDTVVPAEGLEVTARFEPEVRPPADPPPPPLQADRRPASVSPCTIVGTRGDDRIVGTAGPDVICAGEGNDVIWGLAGPDLIRAGPGRDLVRGGDGQDRLIGGSGNDRLVGGRNRDAIFGGVGKDLAPGATRLDVVRGAVRSVPLAVEARRRAEDRVRARGRR